MGGYGLMDSFRMLIFFSLLILSRRGVYVRSVYGNSLEFGHLEISDKRAFLNGKFCGRQVKKSKPMGE